MARKRYIVAIEVVEQTLIGEPEENSFWQDNEQKSWELLEEFKKEKEAEKLADKIFKVYNYLTSNK